MDRTEFLRAVKAPSSSYNLGGAGRDDERFNLVQTHDGRWEVYFSERGQKTLDLFFDTESEALEYLLQELSQ